MLTHIVFFKWKRSAKKAEINGVLRGLDKLSGKIKGIIDISSGENLKTDDGFTHTLIVIAKDMKALDVYRSDPRHNAIAAKIAIMKLESKAVDFNS